MLIAHRSVWELAVRSGWGRVPQQTLRAPGCSCHSKRLGGSCHVAPIRNGTQCYSCGLKDSMYSFTFLWWCHAGYVSSGHCCLGGAAQGTECWEWTCTGQSKMWCRKVEFMSVCVNHPFCKAGHWVRLQLFVLVNSFCTVTALPAKQNLPAPSWGWLQTS